MDYSTPTRIGPVPYDSQKPGGTPPVTVSPVQPPGVTEPLLPRPYVLPPAPAPGPQPPVGLPKKRKKRRWLRNTLVILLAIPLASQGWAFAIKAGLTPSRTMYMLQSDEPVVYEYVDLDHISRFMVGATIAHEDQQLGSRAGAFDWEELKARAEAHVRGEDDPSGSTIPQQLLKNMFLWEERENPTPVRKALEAGLATQYSYTLDDQRMLELYLNYAQFGPGLYGICAASWYYFNTAPWDMYEYNAWQLQGVLPLPDLVRRASGGGINIGDDAHPAARDLVNGAANVWLPRQLESMGGWEAAAATIGVTDTASAHESKRNNKDACSTMPQSVRDRLDAEAIDPPAPPAS